MRRSRPGFDTGRGRHFSLSAEQAPPSPTRGMAETYGRPIRNSATTHTHVYQSIQKKLIVSSPHPMAYDGEGYLIKKINK